MSQYETAPPFEFFISQRGEIAVICFIGVANRNTIELFEACIQQAEGITARHTIFNFRDLRDLREPFFRPLAKMMADARRRGPVRLAGLNPQHKETLAVTGILRSQEISNNLNDAIVSLFPKMRAA